MSMISCRFRSDSFQRMIVRIRRTVAFAFVSVAATGSGLRGVKTSVIELFDNWLLTEFIWQYQRRRNAFGSSLNAISVAPVQVPAVRTLVVLRVKLPAYELSGSELGETVTAPSVSVVSMLKFV